MLVDLIACLAELLARQPVRPTLIVNGDLLDLAFGSVLEHTTFLFGHTHKPFEKLLPHPHDRRPVRVVNCGGWTVDADVLVIGSDFGGSRRRQPRLIRRRRAGRARGDGVRPAA